MSSRDLTQDVKGKPDKSVIKPSRKPYGMQTHGFKSARKVIKSNMSSVIEESMRKQSEFIKGRVLANAPKSLSGLKNKLEVSVNRDGGKVSMVVLVDDVKGIRSHEDPEIPSEALPESSTEEGGRGSKFISRVFDVHQKKLREENTEAIAEKFSSEVKKAKGRG